MRLLVRLSTSGPACATFCSLLLCLPARARTGVLQGTERPLSASGSLFRISASALTAHLLTLHTQVVQRVDKLRTRWADAKTVRLRDKICFVVGVMNLVITSLIFALRPHWIPLLYSVQTLYFLPLRVWTYTRRKWHYFL